MIPAQLQQHILQLQLDQSENAVGARKLIRLNRQDELAIDMEVLNGNREAAGLRSEAANIRAGFQAAAAAISAVGACCAAIPYVGAAIAAACAAAAAILIAIGNVWAQSKEDEAARIEHEAGKEEVGGKKVADLVETMKEDLKAQEEWVDQVRDKYMDLLREERQSQKA